MKAAEWPSGTFALIPSYKGAAQLLCFLPQLCTVVPRGNICVVDDGSNDETPEICRRYDIRCLSHENNRGKGAALATGFARLLENHAQWILTLDADGQHAVADIAGFLDAVRRMPEAGIVIGRRDMRPGRMPLARIFSNRVTSLILSGFCGRPILDSQCGFRLYNAAFLRKITIRWPRFEMESEVILKAMAADFPVSFIPVQTLYLNGTSHIAHARDTVRWIRAVLSTWFELRRIPRRRKSLRDESAA